MSDNISSKKRSADNERDLKISSGYSAESGEDLAEHIGCYDPTVQHRVIRERLHSLEIINERFAWKFKTVLFNLLQCRADVTFSEVKTQSYHEFVSQLPLPANLNLIHLSPLKGMALFACSADLVFMLVDSLFGGDGRPTAINEKRDFTATEQQIAWRLLTRLLPVYDEAWQSIYPIKSEFIRSETKVKFTHIISSPNDLVVTTSFGIEMGTQSGRFDICIPFSMIEPLRNILTNPPLEQTQVENENWRSILTSEVKNTEVELVATLSEKSYRLSGIMEIKKGDIISFEQPVLIEATVGSVPVLTAQYGCAGNHYALCIDNIITSEFSLFNKEYLQDE